MAVVTKNKQGKAIRNNKSLDVRNLEKNINIVDIYQRLLSVESEIIMERKLMRRGFLFMRKHFEIMDKRFDEQKEYTEKYFNEQKEYSDKYFEIIDKRFNEQKGYTEKHFDLLDKRIDRTDKRITQIFTFLSVISSLMVAITIYVQFFAK